MTAMQTMKNQAGPRLIGTFTYTTPGGSRSRITSHFKDRHEFRDRINSALMFGGELESAELDGKDMKSDYETWIADLPF